MAARLSSPQVFSMTADDSAGFEPCVATVGIGTSQLRLLKQARARRALAANSCRLTLQQPLQQRQPLIPPGGFALAECELSKHRRTPSWNSCSSSDERVFGGSWHSSDVCSSGHNEESHGSCASNSSGFWRAKKKHELALCRVVLFWEHATA